MIYQNTEHPISFKSDGWYIGFQPVCWLAESEIWSLLDFKMHTSKNAEQSNGSYILLQD